MCPSYKIQEDRMRLTSSHKMLRLEPIVITRGWHPHKLIVNLSSI